ncbi:MAG: hypothetical protein D6706_17575, partial [Chloroflexi bacterium]
MTKAIKIALPILTPILSIIFFIPLLASAAQTNVVISEIAWMGTAVSYNHEWIELYNPTSTSIDLTGWQLSAADGTPDISLSGTIPPKGYFLLERTSDNTIPNVPADIIYSGSLNNTGENLFLKNQSGITVDQINASTGWPSGYSTSTARIPMKRIDPAGDGSQPDNWTYSPKCGTPTTSGGITYSCTPTVTAVSQPFQYEIYFNPLITATTTTTVPTQMESRLVQTINNAQTSIDIALYGINRQSIIDALIAAHNRGISVRIVGDNDAAANDYAATYQTLTAAGIPLVTDNSPDIHHNKFMVVDGRILWTGSTNFTDTGLT